MRRYRAEHPEYVSENALKNKARNRALSRLRSRYPEEYQMLVAEEERLLRNDSKVRSGN